MEPKQVYKQAYFVIYDDVTITDYKVGIKILAYMICLILEIKFR